jgi:hypothetical protein
MAPALRGKRRCRLHGGHSSGPRTEQGLARARTARLEHGLRSQAYREACREAHALAALLRSSVIAVKMGLLAIPTPCDPATLHARLRAEWEAERDLHAIYRQVAEILASRLAAPIYEALPWARVVPAFATLGEVAVLGPSGARFLPVDVSETTLLGYFQPRPQRWLD